MSVVDSPRVPDEIRVHYEELVDEANRITQGLGQLELYRTQEIVRRFLPKRTVKILDVGGGAGVHAEWLLADGHEVHLIDPIRSHIERATAALGGLAAFSAKVGEARNLDRDDESCDAVLLLGPLYHLTNREDRIRAWNEAKRVVKPAGLIFAAAISRFASLFDGLSSGHLFDAEFRSVVERDLREGQHRNPSGEPAWFTTAYFHGPGELEAEARDAGMIVLDVVGVEGLAGWLHQLDARWVDPDQREAIVWSARVLEDEPSLTDLSIHQIAVARREQTPPD